MKNIKRLITLGLAVLVFTLSLPTISVFASNDDMRYGRKKLGEMSNGANLQYVYDHLVTNCESAKPEIKINISGRNIDLNKDFGTIYNMFYSDYPEYFWVSGGWDAEFDGTTLTIMPAYTMTESTLSSAKSAYNSKVDELTKGLSGSDYDKAKFLHDRLIDIVTYTSTSNDQNAYGALVEGKAVCNGYTRAYQHLMNKVGIPAWYVRGTSNNPTTNTPIGHAWNLVELDGQWYYTDVTWDDQGKNTFYTYFNITTEQLLKGHTFDSEYASLVPKATATAANYYIKENRSFNGYDQSKLLNLLKKDNNKTQLYINGDVYGFLNSVESNLLSIGNQLGATGAFQASYSASSLGNAVILNIIIVSENHTHKAKTSTQQVNASCLSNGTKAYYICDCGLRFLDMACTVQISDDSQLTIAASAHSPSDWKNDATKHWKECTKCGNETAHTRSAHADSNKDNKCDTCGYVLPVADENGNIVVSGGTSGNSSNGSSSNQTINQNTINQNNTSSDDNNVSTETESTNGTEENITDESETVITDEPISTHEESYLYTGAKPNNAALKWILICGGVAIIVTAGIAVTVILITKKKA